MGDTNYVGSIVKILEKPIQKTLNNEISKTEVRVQFPQVRSTRIIHLVFWGNLARDVANYYQVNDYIMIEGYLSLRDKITSKVTNRKLKKIQITVLKIYPFYLSSTR